MLSVSDRVSVRVAAAAKGGEIPLSESEKEVEFFKFGDRHMRTLLFGKASPRSGQPVHITKMPINGGWCRRFPT
jgi:hypothetical protein